MKKNWFDDYADQDSDVQIEEYDITAAPNDFNVLTIYSFLEKDSIRIPGFQRNYVWDIGRASKLIESLILGLPVPQIFLYEEQRNKFLVIDGQQRLMSIYYFIKQRFPKMKKRVELKSIFATHGLIPESVLGDDEYFENFRLKLPVNGSNKPNPFQNLSYSTLETYKTQFELRTIRNVIIKQNSPKDDDSSMYEIFNRLNTGGVNLRPQEIRMSMYHSPFYDKLTDLNARPAWRRLLALEEPDPHMKDVEILLRGFAMLLEGSKYAPSMARFLNTFSRKCRKQADEKTQYLGQLFDSFLEATTDLPTNAFLRHGRFNVALYEAVFASVCESAFSEDKLVSGKITQAKLTKLQNDPDFANAVIEGTTKAGNVETRLKRAKEILGSL